MQSPITLEEEISKLGKKYATQLNPLRQNVTLLKVEEEQIPVKRQNLQNHRHKLEMEELEQIAQEKEIRERSFNEALLNVQSEKDVREKNEARNKKELKNLDSSFGKPQKHLMRNCAFLTNHKMRKRPCVIRSLPYRRSNSMNNRKQNLQAKVLIWICLNNIVKL